MKKILVLLSFSLCYSNILCQSLKSRDKSNDNVIQKSQKKPVKKDAEDNIKLSSIKMPPNSSNRNVTRKNTKVDIEYTVNIMTNVPEADVYLDDAKVGKGSFSLKLKKGTYKIEARATNFEDASEFVHGDNGLTNVSLTLKEKEQYKTIHYSDATYEGNTIGGKPTNMGKMTWKDGTTYVGQWNDGMREGNGVLSWPNGDQFFGAFRNNNFYGKGVLYLCNGVRETGYFDEEGFWVILKKELITILYENGDSYQGYLYKGSPNGKGIYFFASGDRFDGYWCGTLAKGNYFVKGKTKPKKGFLLDNKVFAKKSRKKEKKWLSMSTLDIEHVQFKQRHVNAKITSAE